ncbi:hypothetical protein Leryth_013205 [Lithospermum erythrorhizon]|nr:hypothetical protein Leryth_013205 [Lithospermum erythrorhizon]
MKNKLFKIKQSSNPQSGSERAPAKHSTTTSPPASQEVGRGLVAARPLYIRAKTTMVHDSMRAEPEATNEDGIGPENKDQTPKPQKPIMFSKSREKSHNYIIIKNDKPLNHSSISSSAPFLLCSLCLPILFIFYVIYTPTLLQFSSLNNNDDVHDLTPTNVLNQSHHNGLDIDEKCDLSKGRWIWDEEGSLYTNFSCTTIPYLRNCFLHGRSDRDFLNWRWKPDQCEPPRFDSKAFLSYVQGKTMAFIGDSLARNQMESLLCLLSSNMFINTEQYSY